MSQGFNEGLETAAKRLEATAADYDQMAANEKMLAGSIQAGGRERAQRIVLFKEKAALLRGQARIVRELQR